MRARAAGIPGDRIVFSGVGKTRDEMAAALGGGIRHFNVESEPELRLLSGVAESLGTVAPIAIRINPDVDPGTHEKISTGKSGDKFGIPVSRVRDATGGGAPARHQGCGDRRPYRLPGHGPRSLLSRIQTSG